MSKKKKVIIIIILIIILAAGGFVAYRIINPSQTKVKETKKLDKIKGFDYHLEDRDTKLYKDEFNKLKKNLESNDINYDEYAKSIAKMFIIDLYTIDNKINKYDVGGLEFVHPDARENYELNVKDTIYKYVNNDSNRDQELPVVSKITIDDFDNEAKFKIKDEDEEDAYEISLSWEYEQDDDYDNEAVIKIVKKDKYLYVVEKTDLEDKTEE